ncbi:hypothetical protein Tco_0241462 [Tanacetum coccineum]
MKIPDLLEKRIKKARQHLNKEKQIMYINKGKEKMVMDKAISDESSDHNPFQVTSDESSDDTLKSSSKDTCSSDCTWEQKKTSKDEERTVYKGRRGQALEMQQSQNQKKPKSRSKHLAPTTPRTRNLYNSCSSNKKATSSDEFCFGP